MSQRLKLINPASIFRMYWETMGEGRSLEKLHEQFPVNPKTGKKVTRDGGYKAMWRWACRPENFDTAYRIFKAAMISHGDLWTDERFKAELKEKGRWVLTRRQFNNWYG